MASAGVHTIGAAAQGGKQKHDTKKSKIYEPVKPVNSDERGYVECNRLDGRDEEYGHLYLNKPDFERDVQPFMGTKDKCEPD